MSIKSTPFGPTILSGKDAERFIEQMDDPPPAEAIASLERGRKLLDSIEWVVQGSDGTAFMFTRSATQDEAWKKFEAAWNARRLLIDPRAGFHFAPVVLVSTPAENSEK